MKLCLLKLTIEVCLLKLTRDMCMGMIQDDRMGAKMASTFDRHCHQHGPSRNCMLKMGQSPVLMSQYYTDEKGSYTPCSHYPELLALIQTRVWGLA